MTSSLNQQVDDQIVVLSQNYPSINTQLVTEQGPEVKQQRRRKKNKGETNCTTFKKRKLTDGQVNTLEFHFVNEHKLESERKDRLAADLGLDPRQVAVWFQNRRTRWKSKRLEDEYSKLKTEHESTVVEKCQLETQVLKLKEQISEAEKEMKKLMERCDGVSSNSQSPSFSTEVMEPPYLGEFGMEGLEDVFYLPEYAPENDYDINELGIWASVYSI